MFERGKEITELESGNGHAVNKAQFGGEAQGDMENPKPRVWNLKPLMDTNSHQYLRHLFGQRILAYSIGIVSHLQTAKAQFDSWQLVFISGFLSASQAYAGFWGKDVVFECATCYFRQ